MLGRVIGGGQDTRAALLLRGVWANRLNTPCRARIHHAAGDSMMLIDFQASGQSAGKAITFGHLESRDVAAALAER